MAVTIRDVAKRLNLSITQVSRALDGYADVSEQTRTRVIQAALEMGYSPSRAARQLRRKRAEAIGCIAPTRVPHFSDPFFSDFIAGLGDAVTPNNLDLLISTAPPDSAAEQAIYRRWVQSGRVDGIVLSRMRLQDWRAEYLAAARIPFVASGHTDLPVRFPFVEIDGRAGMAALVQHLVERGHRRIGFIGGPADLVLQVDRLAGYQQGLEQAGIRLDEGLILESDLTRSGGKLAGGKLLDLSRPPTAVIGVNDLTAIGVLQAAHERGLVVGRDLAVTGFDNIEDSADTHPPLTTLNHPVYQIARRLGEMLMKLVSGEALAEEQVILQPELIIRESSGA
jgi:DNA-binding LacI/PurR family transcriptional regulator